MRSFHWIRKRTHYYMELKFTEAHCYCWPLSAAGWTIFATTSSSAAHQSTAQYTGAHSTLHLVQMCPVGQTKNIKMSAGPQLELTLQLWVSGGEGWLTIYFLSSWGATWPASPTTGEVISWQVSKWVILRCLQGQLSTVREWDETVGGTLPPSGGGNIECLPAVPVRYQGREVFKPEEV